MTFNIVNTESRRQTNELKLINIVLSYTMPW